MSALCRFLKKRMVLWRVSNKHIILATLNSIHVHCYFVAYVRASSVVLLSKFLPFQIYMLRPHVVSDACYS